MIYDWELNYFNIKTQRLDWVINVSVTINVVYHKNTPIASSSYPIYTVVVIAILQPNMLAKVVLNHESVRNEFEKIQSKIRHCHICFQQLLARDVQAQPSVGLILKIQSVVILPVCVTTVLPSVGRIIDVLPH